MERIESDAVGLPVFILDFNGVRPPFQPGFYFSFQEPDADVMDHVGPYETRDLAIEAATNVAHQAIRAQATEALLHPDFDEDDQ